MILLILLLLLIFGLPNWGYSRGWGTGYWPSGLILVIIVILLLTHYY